MSFKNLKNIYTKFSHKLCIKTLNQTFVIDNYRFV